MDSEDVDYTEFIETNEDKDFILVRSIVDDCLYRWGEEYDIFYEINHRNHLIIKTYNLIRKKYLCGPNTRWDEDKVSMISVIVKGFLIQEIAKSK